MTAQMTRPASISFLTALKLKGQPSPTYPAGVADKLLSRRSAEPKGPSRLQAPRFPQQVPLRAGYWLSTMVHCVDVEVESSQRSTLTATAAQHRLLLGCWVCRLK